MDSKTPRDLSPSERRVLSAMLAADFQDAELVRQSAGYARVTGECGCGCPSIWFTRDGSEGGSEIVSEGVLEDDELQAVLLFVTGDRQLAALELMWMTDEPPHGFPDPDDLRVSAR